MALDTIPLRSPDVVMKLDRLGAMHPSRLSFARSLLRRVTRERWRVDRALWRIDAEGFGCAVYRVETPKRTYSLVAFSQSLAPEQRTDRVIATAWDTSYVLCDGVPDEAEIARLEKQAPLQEAGRFKETDLILSRANKSVRLFDAVVQALATGAQPDADALEAVGYLMRTTAVYGNGKFGLADREAIADRPEFTQPFQAEMLTVWLIRMFTVELAEHCAAALAAGQAVRLDPALRRNLGVGNSTGLGMAPFLVRHPTLLNAWITARETALARVRSLPAFGAAARNALADLVRQAAHAARRWRTDDPVQAGRIDKLVTDLDRLDASLANLVDGADRPVDQLYRWAEKTLGLEAQEWLVSLLIEPFGDVVDDLAETMSVDERLDVGVDPTMTSGAMKALIEDHYAWALAEDYRRPEAQAHFWYVSVEKLEPRLGRRAEEDGAALEQPLAFGRDVARLYEMLETKPEAEPIGSLAAHHEFRHVVRRVQISSRRLYAEIRDNLIHETMRPVDLLRCKLAFFGASQFDPRSDRWLRIALFKGMPFPDEIVSPSVKWPA
jgi:hypothetical protein